MAAVVSWLDIVIDPVLRAAGTPGVAVLTFPSRIDMVLSSYPIEQGTTITFPETEPSCRLNAIYFLSGHMDIHVGEACVGAWRPKTACLLRADAPGFRLVARQTGIMSHVCISMPCADLAERFPNGPPAMLGDVLPFGSRVEGIWPISPTPALAEAAQSLIDNGLRDAFEWSRCEPVAMQFLLEALAALTAPDVAQDDHAALQHDQAQALYEALVDDPELDLVDVLGQGLSLRQQREILRVFETRYGLSLRNFRHRLMMDKARAALTDGTLIKQLAYDLGYSHVANFTRAYRRAFGESPSQTLRRRARHSYARTRV